MAVPRRHRQSGMTLMEITVAIAILGMIVGLLFQIISGTVRGRDRAQELLRTPKAENAVLGQIFKDFRYLYWGGLVGNAGFIGKNDTKNGQPADQVHFITARTTRVAGVEDGEVQRSSDDDKESPLTEVGYALKTNEKAGGGDWLELWRREDYFVDDKPTEGGLYTMIYDKIRKFSLRYYPTPEQSTQKEGLEEWDSRIRKGVPYAIILEMELDTVDDLDKTDKRPDPHKITRIILLRGAYNVAWTSPDGEGDPPGN